MAHEFRCVKCGDRHLDPFDFVDGVCDHEVKGICDARHCQTVMQVNKAMSQIERYDMLVECTILTGRNWGRNFKEAADIGGNGIFLFGARVEFAGAVTVWDEVAS